MGRGRRNGRRRKLFETEKNARDFANKVKGNFNDLRDIEGAAAKFSVTYIPNDKTRVNWNYGVEDLVFPESYWKF